MRLCSANLCLKLHVFEVQIQVKIVCVFGADLAYNCGANLGLKLCVFVAVISPKITRYLGINLG